MNEHLRYLEDGQTGQGSVNVVHRSGNSVIRPIGNWSPAIHELLQYLEKAGFEYSPRFLGKNELNGQEQLTYVSGEVALRPWPSYMCTDSGIEQIATMLRKYHDVVANYKPSIKAVWRLPNIKWEEGMLIRHGDLGPWNLVWKDGILRGLIDWDLAEPGYPIDDVAQVAWYCIPLRTEDRCREAGIGVHKQMGRLSQLCGTYGIAEEKVIAALLRLEMREIGRTQQLGGLNIEPWATFLSRGDVEDMKVDLNWLLNQPKFTQQEDSPETLHIGDL